LQLYKSLPYMAALSHMEISPQILSWSWSCWDFSLLLFPCVLNQREKTLLAIPKQTYPYVSVKNKLDAS
jgi:hypothetical protein